MTGDVGADQLLQLHVKGMHCHKCEVAIQKALAQIPGVHEVEVDFNSSLVSVLVEKSTVAVSQLMDAVTSAGYQPTGFTQGTAGRMPAPGPRP